MSVPVSLQYNDLCTLLYAIGLVWGFCLFLSVVLFCFVLGGALFLVFSAQAYMTLGWKTPHGSLKGVNLV